MAGNMFGVLLLSLIMVLVASAEVLERSNKLDCSIEEDQLSVYRVPKHSCSCSPKSEGTLRYHNKKLQICDGGKYVDVGGAAAPPPEPGRENDPGTSCNEILSKRSGAGNGVYYLNLKGKVTRVYCHMDEICGSRGWTLILKMDGNKQTFEYESTYWTSHHVYNVEAVSKGLHTNQEMKLSSYSNFGFSTLCLGMEVGGAIRWLSVPKKASSLYSVLAGNSYQATKLGRNKWKSLIAGSSLQRNCNREGFNVDLASINARVGIVSNQENDCSNPDSYVGFGINTRNPCGLKTFSAGNGARCSPDNGDKNTPAMGFILAQ